VVFLGDRAFKTKKPVDLGFLDFRSREARERIAHREVELNRRLAPDVYLGVADVHDADGRVCDHVVVMQRLPEDRRLSTLVDTGADVDDDVRAIARILARFHASAETSRRIDAAGSPTAVRARIESDLSELGTRAVGILDDGPVDELTALACRYLAGRSSLLEARVAHGFVRDGHGDLLSDDIFCLPDGPRILDCIEFDDALRHGDVLADLAFLAMDLEARGATAIASRLLAWYAEFGGERHPASLADYYIAQRAIVRAKVACIRAEQGHEGAPNEARALAALALGHLRRGRVRMVLVGGPPGTGKTTLASGTSDNLGWTLLRSDEIRKDLVDAGHTQRATAHPNAGIYDAATTRATYATLLERARRALEHGESVVLDASWSRASDRVAAAAIADATSSDLIQLRCDVPASVATARVTERRVQGTDASDADATIAQLVRAEFEPWPTAIVVDTERTTGDVLDETVAILTEPSRTHRS
jgi:aminoglycoside phosphotransferase family enzyme/predicted kinase